MELKWSSLRWLSKVLSPVQNKFRIPAFPKCCWFFKDWIIFSISRLTYLKQKQNWSFLNIYSHAEFLDCSLFPVVWFCFIYLRFNYLFVVFLSFTSYVSPLFLPQDLQPWVKVFRKMPSWEISQSIILLPSQLVR